jgi:hypothetical protein
LEQIEKANGLSAVRALVGSDNGGIKGADVVRKRLREPFRREVTDTDS